MTERESMERDRDYAAMGLLPPDAMRDCAVQHLLKGYGCVNSDPVMAWERIQLAADLLRASLPTKEVA